MKRNKLISAIMTVVITISSVLFAAPYALAGEVQWSFDENTSTLTVSGLGAMQDYSESDIDEIPWRSVAGSVQKVIIEEGITHIGDYTFCRMPLLSQVELPETLESIGDVSFAGNNNLLSLTIPDSVSQFGWFSFGYDYEMKITEGFTAICSAGSPAQEYCVMKYIPFESPFSSSMTDVAVISSSNAQCMWSFVSRTNGYVHFWSTGTQDTHGIIYEADSYVYNSSFATMQKSAVAVNDDASDDDLNFNVSCYVQAGKRYYLSAKYHSPTKTSGTFDVYMSFDCVDHIYESTVISEPECTEDGCEQHTCIECGDTYNTVISKTGHKYNVSAFENETAQLECERCSDTEELLFMDYYHTSNPYLDVVSDGVVNAKDYAKLNNGDY